MSKGYGIPLAMLTEQREWWHGVVHAVLSAVYIDVALDYGIAVPIHQYVRLGIAVSAAMEEDARQYLETVVPVDTPVAVRFLTDRAGPEVPIAEVRFGEGRDLAQHLITLGYATPNRGV